MRDFPNAQFVFVSSRTGPVMGRVERRLLRVMAALVSRGSGVHLICPPRSPLEPAARELGVEVAPYHLDKLNFFKTRSRVRKYLERYRPLVVHSTGLEADLIARWSARELPTAAVNTIPCTDWPRTGSDAFARAVRRYLEYSTLPLADAIVTDCRAIAADLVERGVPADRVGVDPPSVDVAEVLRQAEEHFALPPARVSGPRVGYGGRIEDSRGLELLVAASAILVARGSVEEVLIAGEGPLLKRLQTDIRSSRVRYLGWVDSVPAALRQFDVCVFPSTAPGVPTSLLEAAVLGRPIVAARIGGIEELFEDGREIRLVDPGDPKALAAGVAEMLGDPETAAEMGGRARHRALDEYSSAASVERHLALYRRFMRK